MNTQDLDRPLTLRDAQQFVTKEYLHEHFVTKDDLAEAVMMLTKVISDQITDLRNEMREGFQRLESRTTATEHALEGARKVMRTSAKALAQV